MTMVGEFSNPNPRGIAIRSKTEQTNRQAEVSTLIILKYNSTNHTLKNIDISDNKHTNG